MKGDHDDPQQNGRSAGCPGRPDVITPGAFGIVSGILQIASFCLMIKPVAWPRRGRKRQQPHRVSWLGWVCLYQVMFWASFARGATGSLWIVGAEVIGTLIMFCLSLKWGEGSLKLTRTSRSGPPRELRSDPEAREPRITVTSWPDLLVLCFTAAGLAGWQIFSSASLGIIVTVAVAVQDLQSQRLRKGAKVLSHMHERSVIQTLHQVALPKCIAASTV